MELLNIKNEEGPCTLDKLAALAKQLTLHKNAKNLAIMTELAGIIKEKNLLNSHWMYLNSQKWIFSSFYSGLTFLLIFV